MPESAVYDVIDDMAILRIAGQRELWDAVARITGAIVRSKELCIDKLLVVATKVEFDPPSLVTRIEIAREWAEAARSAVRIALVVRPEFIDPDRFGVIAARNLGLSVNVFVREPTASAWLAH